MRCEHGGDVHFPDPRHDETDAGHPLVEMRDDSRRSVAEVLRQEAEVAEKFGHHESEDGDVVALDVLVGDSDAGFFEQLLLEIVHAMRGGSDFEEDDLRVSVDEPTTAMQFVAFISRPLDGLTQGVVVRKVLLVDLLLGLGLHVGPEEDVLIAELVDGHARFGPDHRVNAADFIANLRLQKTDIRLIGNRFFKPVFHRNS